jgi:hypothetical protein
VTAVVVDHRDRRARIERQQDAAYEAGVYRATRLARRAFGDERG